MADRIHYRHSSKDRQKHFLGLALKIRATVLHTHIEMSFNTLMMNLRQLLISLFHSVNDNMRLLMSELPKDAPVTEMNSFT